jgi:hypothetical protein
MRRETNPKPPRSSGPVQGCPRCRGTGAIDVLLCRAGHAPASYAVRCGCPASAGFCGLVSVGRFIEGWSRIGAVVVEWPTVKDRAA